MQTINKRDLHHWCSILYDKLIEHSPKIPYEIVTDSKEMGEKIDRELAEKIKYHNKKNEVTRDIIPCGPSCWYEPFAKIINSEKINLKNLVVFHMDECLDWQGNLLPQSHPYNFRTTMEQILLNPILILLKLMKHKQILLSRE